MAYIFLDESGDLGFDFKKKKTSKNFVITLMFVIDKNPVEKSVKKIYEHFSKKEIKMHHGTLHAFKEIEKTRKKLLNLLKEKEISIIAIHLNKKKVYTHLQETKHALYNYVTNIVLDRIYSKKIVPPKEIVHLIASRRETNRFLNKNFKKYIKKQLEDKYKIKINIEIKPPHEEKCLQAVDMVSWAIFRYKEHSDKNYFNLIKKRIIEDNPLFP